MGVIFGTLAIPLGLEGRWTGAAWAVEAAGMYWLGARQGRVYARAFSFLVFAGAVWKLLEATQLDAAPGHPLLQGSVIGPMLVAVSAFAMWAIHRRAKLDEGNGWEALVGTAFPMKVSAALQENALNQPMKAIDMVNTFSHYMLAPPPSALGPRPWLYCGSKS